MCFTASSQLYSLSPSLHLHLINPQAEIQAAVEDSKYPNSIEEENKELNNTKVRVVIDIVDDSECEIITDVERDIGS